MKKLLDEIMGSNGLSVPKLTKLAGKGEASIYGFAVEDDRDVRSIWWSLRKLRKLTRHWPVFLGDSDDVEDLVDRLEFHSIDDVKNIIQKARDLDLQAWKERTALAVIEDIFSYRPHPERYFAGSDWIQCGRSGKRFIGMVPYSQGWKSAAYLNFGGWSDCPPPEVQTRFFRRWNRLFSAEIFSITKEAVGMIVHDPPSEKTVANEIRKELFCFLPTRGRGIERNDGYFENVINKSFWHFKWSYPWNNDVYGYIDLDSLITNGERLVHN